MEQPNAKDDQGNPKIQQEKDEMDQDVDDVINNLDNKLNITQDEIDKDDGRLTGFPSTANPDRPRARPAPLFFSFPARPCTHLRRLKISTILA